VRPLHGLLYAVAGLIGVQLFTVATVAPSWVNGLVSAAAGICALVFLYRARVNADALSLRRPHWSKGWVIGAWFIPVANAVLVPLVLLDLAKSSTRRPGALGLVVGWAVLFFGNLFLNAWNGGTTAPSWASFAASAVAGLLFVALLWWIADGQARAAPSTAV
jgi:hypothetical protein